mmetsp:Transcript_18117/g.49707  ORF Transcript_18117/g.49707 Transcript_18117/m.49707 type:complete len:214 (-) Transcript_18117:1643-2284(-)
MQRRLEGGRQGMRAIPEMEIILAMQTLQCLRELAAFSPLQSRIWSRLLGRIHSSASSQHGTMNWKPKRRSIAISFGITASPRRLPMLNGCCNKIRTWSIGIVAGFLFILKIWRRSGMHRFLLVTSRHTRSSRRGFGGRTRGALNLLEPIGSLIGIGCVSVSLLWLSRTRTPAKRFLQRAGWVASFISGSSSAALTQSTPILFLSWRAVHLLQM